MKYMLDTNICIYLIKKKPVKILNHVTKLKISDVCISSITLAELEYGVEKSEKINQNKLALIKFLTPVEIRNFDGNAAQKYGVIRSELERSGNIIGPYDMLIAAHALSLKYILVTNNTKEFKRIKNLKLENWA